MNRVGQKSRRACDFTIRSAILGFYENIDKILYNNINLDNIIVTTKR